MNGDEPKVLSLAEALERVKAEREALMAKVRNAEAQIQTDKMTAAYLAGQIDLLTNLVANAPKPEGMEDAGTAR